MSEQSDCRILIVGGSNSVMEPGYMTKFSDCLRNSNSEREFLIDNISVGANSCIRGLEALKYQDISTYDAFIIEYFINDFPLYSMQGKDFWLASYEGLIRYILSKNPRAIIVPLLLGRRDSKFFEIQDEMRAYICLFGERYGIYLLDFDKFAKETFSDTEFHNLYLDARHYKRPDVTDTIGVKLAEMIGDLVQRTSPARNISLIPSLSAHPFTNAICRSFCDEAPPEFARKIWKNSRYEVEAVRLRPAHPLTLSVRGTLLSISYVSASDAGQLVLEETNAPVRAICTLHKDIKDKKFAFLLKTSSFPNVNWHAFSGEAIMRLEIETAQQTKLDWVKIPSMIRNEAPVDQAVHLVSWLSYAPEQHR